MRYDVDIDPENLNTSHAVVIDLVGTGKRVLDVGCSTGQLGKLLVERGNNVLGVEIDPAAAAIAEQYLEQVVVGDLETTSLSSMFDADSFDVIVFADVLEHLRDPAGVLSSSRELLGDGGSVVISIPNVAHADVRLALLDGNFDYRELGLLDSTHIRFFTKATLDSFLRASGFMPTDFRRTTAEIFATEIVLDPLAFTEDLIANVADSPESTTYQFVVRAVPLSGNLDVGAIAGLVVAREQELQELRTQLSVIVKSLGPGSQLPTVGLISWTTDGTGESPFTVLRSQVVACEIRRRLHGIAVRRYNVCEPSTALHDEGEPITSLQPWRGERIDQIASETAAVVITGPRDAQGSLLPSLADLRVGLESRGRPVLTMGAFLEQDGNIVPLPVGDVLLGAAGEQADAMATEDPAGMSVDPLVLCNRLFAPGLLDARVDYLRAVDQLDADHPFVVVSLSARLAPIAPAVCRSLVRLAEASDAQLIFLDHGGPLLSAGTSGPFVPLVPAARALIGDRPTIDVLAVVKAARVVVSDCPDILAVALAMGTPYMAISASPPSAALLAFLMVTEDPDVLISRPDQLEGSLGAASDRAADSRQRGRMVASAEMTFDDLVGTLTGALAKETTRSVIAAVAELKRRVQELETANAGLQRRMSAERLALGQRAATLATPTMRSYGESTTERVKELAELAETRHEVKRLREELEAVANLKTMRLLRPARETYGRLRFRNR